MMLERFAWLGMILALGCGGGSKGAAEVTGATNAPAATTATPTDTAAPIDPRRKQLESATNKLAAGRKAFDEGDFGKAMLEAQRGLDVLGKDYAGTQVEDDTDLKIRAAKERAELGSPSDGATVMLRMLAERIELARSHWQIMP